MSLHARRSKSHNHDRSSTSCPTPIASRPRANSRREHGERLVGQWYLCGLLQQVGLPLQGSILTVLMVSLTHPQSKIVGRVYRMREMQWYNTIIRPKNITNAMYTINCCKLSSGHYLGSVLRDPFSSLLLCTLLSCSITNSSFQRQEFLEKEFGLVYVQLLIESSVNQISRTDKCMSALRFATRSRAEEDIPNTLNVTLLAYLIDIGVPQVELLGVLVHQALVNGFTTFGFS